MAPVDPIFENTSPLVSTELPGSAHLVPGETPFSGEGLSAVPAQKSSSFPGEYRLVRGNNLGRAEIARFF